MFLLRREQAASSGSCPVCVYSVPGEKDSMMIFVSFLSSSGQTMEQNLNPVRVPFLAHHSQFIAHAAAKLRAV